MKNIRYVDVGYLQGCVFMGGLAYYFAKNIMKYNLEGNKIFRSDEGCDNFKVLIEKLYKYFNIKNGDLDFIRYRDEILNQGGITSIPFEDVLINKRKLETVIEHLLLNILNFDGLYWDRASKHWVEYKSLTA